MAPTRIKPSNQVHLQRLGTDPSVPVIFSGAAARVFHRSFLAKNGNHELETFNLSAFHLIFG